MQTGVPGVNESIVGAVETTVTKGVTPDVGEKVEPVTSVTVNVYVPLTTAVTETLTVSDKFPVDEVVEVYVPP